MITLTSNTGGTANFDINELVTSSSSSSNNSDLLSPLSSTTSINMPAVTSMSTSGLAGLNANNSTANTNSVEYMPLFDTRLYRSLGLYESGNINSNFVGGSDEGNGRSGSAMTDFYPHYSYGSYVSDYYESDTAVLNELEDYKANNKEFSGTDTYNQTVKMSEARAKFIKEFNDKYKDKMLAPHSFIHPYAIVKLTGAAGNENTVKQLFTYDKAGQRKWYEIDGDSKGGYANNPTTTTLIKWGNEDIKGRTPYSFQDFVFCKYWNKIQNNRMITLRRYSAPVTDAITFSDYATTDTGSGTANVKVSDSPWAPLATAVTYFGDGTNNSISDLLSFTAGYNWEELKANADPIMISSSQSEQGNDLTQGFAGVSSGLGMISTLLGFTDTYKAAKSGSNGGVDPQLAARDMPPDPYVDGPYENRIMGPINVIMNTYKRQRGLHFSQDLKLTFDYVARPIAGINNKAVLLDILSNILVMCYSSGSWFGGMWKYKTDDPAIYPFKYGDVMNKLYKGQLFGKNGAAAQLIKSAYQDLGGEKGKNGLFSEMFKDAISTIQNLISGTVDSIVGAINGDKNKKASGSGKLEDAGKSATVRTLEKIVAAKALKGATIPYIHNQKALLTGDPVGDWHLTIGNPLNPIAMIGNLIVKDVEIKFSDELGPDDFPIGFTAIITLAHGLGRDRDAIESMFNRGFGRIYSLPMDFRSSADGETKVDENSGTGGTERTKYEETRNTFFGRGFRFIAKTQTSKLANGGDIFYGLTNNYSSVKSLSQDLNNRTTSQYLIDPWQTKWCL